MNYQNKYNDFRAEVIIQLHQVLKEKEYERSPIENAPQELCYNNEEWYSIVKWDGADFKGIGNESQDEYYFGIEELSLLNLCKILDYINEQD